MPLFCSYHTLTPSVIYYWTDVRQHGIYLLNRSASQTATWLGSLWMPCNISMTHKWNSAYCYSVKTIKYMKCRDQDSDLCHHSHNAVPITRRSRLLRYLFAKISICKSQRNHWKRIKEEHCDHNPVSLVKTRRSQLPQGKSRKITRYTESNHIEMAKEKNLRDQDSDLGYCGHNSGFHH